MSLRAFHIFFILLSTAFCIGFFAWSIHYYRQGYQDGLWLSAVALAATGFLIPYLRWFVRKYRIAS